MKTITDLKLDNDIGLKHELRICEGLVFTVKVGANTQIRVRALDKKRKAGEIDTFDYYFGILEITCGEEASKKFLELDPPAWVVEKVMGAVWDIFNKANNPEIAIIEGIGEKN